MHVDRINGGDGTQLREQVLGALLILAVSGGSTLALSLALRFIGVLRVDDDEEDLGGDATVFGMRAYVNHNEILGRYHRVSSTLEQQGLTPVQLLDALTGFRTIIYKPFTPQAADNKIEGEMMDILEHLQFDVSSNDAEYELHHNHLAFLSHHKAHAGEAARIFRDTALRLTTDPSVLEADTDATLKEGTRVKHPTRGEGIVAELMGDGRTRVKFDNGEAHQYKPSSMHKITRVTTSKGANATGEGDPRISLRRQNSQSAISSVVDAALRTIAPKDLFFLDSTNLHSVQDLEPLVNRSANYLLFLTAEVLQRPAVLVEICAAHVARKNIIPVMVDFPGALGGGTDARQFIFPQHLEQAIEELAWCIAHEGKPIPLTGGSALWRVTKRSVQCVAKGESRRPRRGRLGMRVQTPAADKL